MYCPLCGTENTNDAKFCRNCGAPLASCAQEPTSANAPASEPVAASVALKGDAAAGQTGAQGAPADLAAERDAPAAQATEHRMPAAQGTPVDQGATTAQPAGWTASAKQPTDQSATADQPGQAYSYNATYAAPASVQPAAAPSQPGIGAKIAAMPVKQKAIIGGVAAVVLIAIIAVVMVMNGGPSDSAIEGFVRQANVASSMSEGDNWSDGGEYELKSVKVLSKTKDTSGTQSLTVFGNQLSEPYDARVEVVLANGDTEVTKQGNMSLAKVNGQWDCLSFSSSNLSTTDIKLTKGVSKKKVIKNIDTILTTAGAKNGVSYLSSKYSGGTFKIKNEKLDSDKRTDTVTISLKKETEFSESKGTVKAVFAYGDQGWELEKATASKDAEDVSYQKLVGTWKGEFKKQSQISGSCFGGKANPVTVTITSFDDKTGKVDGTFTGLAHYHKQADNTEDSDAGDTMITDQSFSMTFKIDDGWKSLSDSYETAQDSNGQVTLKLDFDEDDGPTATLTTSYQPESILNWNTTYDTFTLTKEK